jgi:hypothetical protein
VLSLKDDESGEGLDGRKPEAEFRRAGRLYRLGKYAEALEAYTRCLFRLKDNQSVYLGLGLCLLATNDFNKAHYYFERINDKDPMSRPALVALAYLDLIEGRESAALQKYTQLIKLKYNVVAIKKILNHLRKSGNARDFAIAQPADFFWIGREFPRKKNKWIVPLGLTSLAVLTVGFLVYSYFPKNISSWFPRAPSSVLITGDQLYPPLKKTNLTLAPQPKDYEERLKAIYLYDLPQNDKTFSSATLLKLFEDTKKAIVKGEVNLAQVNVNRVLQSEANLLLKEKFRLIESAIPEPIFANFENTFRMKEMTAHAYYEKCWVKYRGLVGKKRESGKVVVFDFTFEDDADTWTAQVELEKIPGFELESGRQVVLLARYLGFDEHFKKPILNAVVLKRFVN